MSTPDPSPYNTTVGAPARAPRDGRTVAVMSAEDAAHYLRINKKTLDRMHGRGDGPKIHSLDEQNHSYRQADIDDFLAARVRLNTAEA